MSNCTANFTSVYLLPEEIKFFLSKAFEYSVESLEIANVKYYFSALSRKARKICHSQYESFIIDFPITSDFSHIHGGIARIFPEGRLYHVKAITPRARGPGQQPRIVT